MDTSDENTEKNIKRWMIAGGIAFLGLIMFFNSIYLERSEVNEILFFYLGFIIFTSSIAGVFGSKKGAIVGFVLGFIVIQVFTSFLGGEPWDGFSVFMRGLFGGVIGSIGGYVMGGLMDRISHKEDQSNQYLDQTQENHCPYCDSSIPAQAQYCPICGNRFEQYDEETGIKDKSDFPYSSNEKQPKPSQNVGTTEIEQKEEKEFCNICGGLLDPSDIKRCDCGMGYHEACLLDRGRCPNCKKEHEKFGFKIDTLDEVLREEKAENAESSNTEMVIEEEEKKKYMNKLENWKQFGFEVDDLEQLLVNDRMEEFKRLYYETKKQIEGE